MVFHGLNTEEIAILINENARKVTGRIRRALGRLISRANLYYSSTKDEARQYIEEIVERRLTRVFSAGGDGSVVALINMLKEYVDKKNAELERLLPEIRKHIPKYQLPQIGILKLGTGNGWADSVGVKKGIKSLKDFLRGNRYRVSNFNILESGKRYFPFAGMGWDAAILNDYIKFKNIPRGILSRYLLNGLFGYLYSMFTRTIPRVLRENSPEVEIKFQGNELYTVSHSKGIQRKEIECGSTVFNGDVNVMGASTMPNYGFKLKAYPFARAKEGLMNLRIVRAGVSELLSHWPSIWMGRYESENFCDFLVDKISVSFSREVPLQIAGDAEGSIKEMSIQVADHSIEIIDFTPFKESLESPGDSKGQIIRL